MLFSDLKNQLQQIYQQLLPSTCILCGFFCHSAANLCRACHQDLPILPDNCQKCAQFLSGGQTLCGSCLIDPPLFERTYALSPYETPIVELITQLKFQKKLLHAHTLGQLFIEKIRTQWYRKNPLPDVIIPVPLHIIRLQQRGFNQSVEIARPIARALKIPLDWQGLIRHKATEAQSGLAAKDRELNLKNAFSAQKYYSGKVVALIDDVITTGSTISECCKTLHKAGVKTIHVWCCARRG